MTNIKAQFHEWQADETGTIYLHYLIFFMKAIVCALGGVAPNMDCKFWSQQAVDRIKELLPPTQQCMRMYRVTCLSRNGDQAHVKLLDANGKRVLKL